MEQIRRSLVVHIDARARTHKNRGRRYETDHIRPQRDRCISLSSASSQRSLASGKWPHRVDLRLDGSTSTSTVAYALR
jgi:hypothetical protein